MTLHTLPQAPLTPLTPLMQQYHAVKIQYPEALILFQVGDFYELFYEDAQRASAFLGITLTKRGKSDGEPIPLCGVPRHASDQYIIKLVQGGFSVVVCDQYGDVEQGRLVDRRVSGVFTPGTVHDARLLDTRSATILSCIARDDHATALLFFELITGSCSVALIPNSRDYLFAAEIARYAPRECVIVHNAHAADATTLLNHYSCRVVLHTISSGRETYRAWLGEHTDSTIYQVIARSNLLQSVTHALHSYLAHYVPEGLARIEPIQLYAPDDFLLLDAVTQRNLELVTSLQDMSRQGTLFSVLDCAVTAMGSRMIRRWILQPLRNIHQIDMRHSGVQYLIDHVLARKRAIEALKMVGDLERITGRIMLHRATAADYTALARALPGILELLPLSAERALQDLMGSLNQHEETCQALADLLQRALQDDSLMEGAIRRGYDARLDQLRERQQAGAGAVEAFEAHERERTGIASLKVRPNGVYGYGIEITRPNRHLVPAGYRLVQTLVNRDRFVTNELVELEQSLRTAEQEARLRDAELFSQIQGTVASHGPLLCTIAAGYAALDAIVGFAEAAIANRYVRPQMELARNMHITAGRHPVVEKALTSFVPNSLILNDSERMWVITGPNMGGKSTFLRQNALIIIMAQAGSFVPADRALLPIFDRLFTRIGASDNVSEGKSTFFVEMEEVARMCHEATAESFVILDELGRGTSTYDGIALAQSVLEYVYSQIQPFLLCATHYHEVAHALTKGEGFAIGAYHAATARTTAGVVLLHTICRGIAEGSFGIAVARTAGIPDPILRRAELVLHELVHNKSVSHHSESNGPRVSLCIVPEHMRYATLAEQIGRLSLDDITPRQALALLHEFVARITPSQ